MIVHRRTLAGPAHFEGLGLHSGVPVKLTIHPSDDRIAFRTGSERVRATPENVSDTTRCTRLGSISTIEHLMSAFAGLEITDAEVELDAPELPGLDGSAIKFVEGILMAGLEGIGEVDRPGLFRRVFFHEDATKIAAAKGEGHWRYIFETGERWPGTQSFELESVIDRYSEDIASARTFAFAEEVPKIIQMGLAKGLDETSAVILGIDGYKNEARFTDESARHKLLDLIGDLYLAGIPIRHLNVTSERSGHSANVKAAAMLAKATEA